MIKIHLFFYNCRLFVGRLKRNLPLTLRIRQEDIRSSGHGFCAFCYTYYIVTDFSSEKPLLKGTITIIILYNGLLFIFAFFSLSSNRNVLQHARLFKEWFNYVFFCFVLFVFYVSLILEKCVKIEREIDNNSCKNNQK